MFEQSEKSYSVDSYFPTRHKPCEDEDSVPFPKNHEIISLILLSLDWFKEILEEGPVFHGEDHGFR